MDTLETNELSTSLLRKDENGSFTLRIVEREGDDGLLHREFGIAESTYCNKTGRWVSPRRQHPLVPLSLWPTLVKHGQLIIGLHGFGCEPVALDSAITEPISSGNITTCEQQEQLPKCQNYDNDNTSRTELSKLVSRPRGRPCKSVTKEPRRGTQKPSHGQRVKPTKQTVTSTESSALPSIRVTADVEAKQFSGEGTAQCDNAGNNTCVAANAAGDGSVPMSVEQHVAK